MGVLTDEGMMRAACVIRDACDKAARISQITDDAELLRRLEVAVQQFHDTVKRLILDGPNPLD